MQEKMDNKYSQYANSQVDYGEVKKGAAGDDILNVKTVNSAEAEAIKEYERFKEKLQKIAETSKSYNDAKDLVKQSFKINNNGTSYLRVGNAYCTITITSKLVAIILNSKEELISYCFNTYTKEEKERHEEKLS